MWILPLFSPLANVCRISPWAPITHSTWCIHPWLETTDGGPHVNCPPLSYHTHTHALRAVCITSGASPLWRDNSSSRAGTRQTALAQVIATIHYPAEIIPCPSPEPAPWRWAMGKCTRIAYLSRRQVWFLLEVKLLTPWVVQVPKFHRRQTVSLSWALVR